MATLSRATQVGTGHAQTRIGPTGGYSSTTTSAAASVDLSVFAGSYVDVWCEDSDHYLVFVGTDDTTTVISDGTNTTSVETLRIPTLIASGAAGKESFVVPRDRPVLLFKTTSGSGRITINPA